MNKLVKYLGAALLAGTLFATIPACQKQEGPAEKAGKAVDNAVDKAGQEMEKAGNEIQDAAKGDKK